MLNISVLECPQSSSPVKDPERENNLCFLAKVLILLRITLELGYRQAGRQAGNILVKNHACCAKYGALN
jgi:hypothetical protein